METTNGLKVGDKVEIDKWTIENSEYKFQFSAGKVRKAVYVYSVIETSTPVFVFKLSPKAKGWGTLPVKFITKIVSSGTKLYY
jgi:hypothetical protein